MKRESILVTIFIILQLCIYLFYGFQKQDYHIDEYFSFEATHYYSDKTPDRVTLYKSEVLKSEDWVSNAELKKTIVVDEGDVIDDLFVKFPHYMTKSHSYFIILNYVEYLFFRGQVSKWAGIFINIVFVILFTILMALFSKRFIKNDVLRMMLLTFFFLNGFTISLMVYTRFYILCALLLMIYIWLHWAIFSSENVVKTLSATVASIVVLYLSYNNSELSVIFGVVFSFFFLLNLVLRKQYRKAIAYFGIYGLFGGGYLVFFTNYVKALFGSYTKVQSKMGKGNQYVTFFHESSLMEKLGNVKGTLEYLNYYLFGNKYLTALWALIILIALCGVIKKSISKKEKWKTEDYYVEIVGLSSVVYLLVASILGMDTFRYYYFSIFGICFSMIYIVGKYFEGSSIKPVVRETAISTAVILCVLVVLLDTHVENVYAYEKEFMGNIAELSGLDTILDDEVDPHAYYIVSDRMDADTKVMIKDFGAISDWPDDFLLWTDVEDISKLTEAGYTVDIVGKPWCYVYHCCLGVN